MANKLHNYQLIGFIDWNIRYATAISVIRLEIDIIGRCNRLIGGEKSATK